MSRSLLFFLLVGLATAPPLIAAEPGKSQHVPYKLTDTMHILVRVRIEGKGPYNFIVDTGAPGTFVSKEVGTKLGLKSEKGWAVLEQLELEGGVKFARCKVRVDTPFQLEGMNAMGFPGAELHGVLGYTELARFKLELDFTRDRLSLTPLQFTPPPPAIIGGKGGAPAGLSALGSVMKLFSLFLGKRQPEQPVARGCLGLELGEEQNGVVVRRVLGGSPAQKAGVKEGDRISALDGTRVKRILDLRALTAELVPGTEVNLTVRRGQEEKELTITAGEGL